MAAAAAAAALAPADPPSAMPQAAGAGGPTARRDFYWLRSFLAGGIAGCCAKTTVAPLDRVKVLLQAHNHHYKHLGVFSALFAVPRKEGFLGLYKGNGAMMIRIFPYGAIQFMAFEHYKTFITTKLGVSGHVHRLMAGSMAGMTAVICTYPLDMVRVRLAFQVKGEHTYTGIIHAFKTIYAKEGGFFGFYRGLMPTILGMAPYAGVSFFHFWYFTRVLGGVAGAIAQTNRVRTVLPEFEKCLTMRDTMKYVYGHHGIRKGLYRGLSLNYIRCVPSQAVAFTTYELMKQFFHLN
uniref:Solute carrier family 25 member 16 n=1 Tax=Aotus nancymaae TaxID=37293 RepID=A0A2K5C6Y8_AOTNA